MIPAKHNKKRSVNHVFKVACNLDELFVAIAVQKMHPCYNAHDACIRCTRSNQLLLCWIYHRKCKNIFVFLSYINTEWHMQLISFLLEFKDLIVSHSQQRASRWPGNEGSHGINSHRFDLVLPKFPCHSIRMVKMSILCTYSLNIWPMTKLFQHLKYSVQIKDCKSLSKLKLLVNIFLKNKFKTHTASHCNFWSYALNIHEDQN